MGRKRKENNPILELPPDVYDRVVSEAKRLRIDPAVLIDGLLKMLVNETDENNETNRGGGGISETNVTLISLDEAAKMLCISRSSISRMCKQGDIQSVKIGARVLLPLNAVKKAVSDYAQLLSNSPYVNGLEEYISVSKASNYLGISRDTLHNWIRDGKFPACRPGRSYLIKKKDLDAFMRNKSC